ncbi:hypothetical protein ACJJTC_000673, partial [Scirpophaga incertulas]
MYASLQTLRRSHLSFTVMKPRWCAPSRVIGEASLDLGSVWDQPNHHSHKWVQLILPNDTFATAVGFLNVEVIIVVRGDMRPVSSIENKESLEKNLLMPLGVEEQHAKYLITIYSAFNLSRNIRRNNKNHVKLPSTYVKVNFCGFVATTGVQPKNTNPIYCEEISIVNMFPNEDDEITFEVCSVDGSNRSIGCVTLKLGWICHAGENGFLPTFGPSLLHLYGASRTVTTVNSYEDGPYHNGAILVALKTIVPFFHQSIKHVTVQPAVLIQPEKSWQMENFFVYCSLLEVSMLNCKMFGTMSGVSLTMSEISIENNNDLDEELTTIITEMKSRKLHYTGPINVTKYRSAYGYLDFKNQYPVLQLAVNLPDFRFRMYRNNMLQKIISDLESSVACVQEKLHKLDYNYLTSLQDYLDKSMEKAIAGIEKLLNSSDMTDTNHSSQSNWTELDIKQHAFLKNEMHPEKILMTTNYLEQRSACIEHIDVSDSEIINDEVEPLSSILFPDLTKYKIDIYWWGLRNVSITREPFVALEIDDVTIKSDIVQQKTESCNFANGRISHIFETSFNSSTLRILLCDSGTFGRAHILGTTMEKYPNKYTVSWIAQNEREISIASASIIPSQFTQVNEKTFIKKSSQALKYSNDINVHSVMICDEEYEEKQNTFNKLFSKKKLPEEQNALLAVIDKVKKKDIAVKKFERLNNRNSWWYRYYSSIKTDEQGNIIQYPTNIKVYDFELEAQPEFSKFKDWCFSIKLYRGDKTHNSKKDDQICCGFLKVGIAIYKWPPLADEIVVTTNGVNLKNGYFEDFPYNEPAQFIVRVYLVKGINIVRKHCIGKFDPYVILSCGEKIVGDSRCLLQDNVYPIFG